MSITYCRECERVVEGKTITCPSCMEELCSDCFEMCIELDEDSPNKPAGSFYIDPRYLIGHADK